MKIFSQSFLNDYKILNDALVGIEFEFFSKMSYINTLEYLNKKLLIDVIGFNEYHPDTKPTEKQWLLTPDWSAINMCELITHPMTYSEAIIFIPKVLSLIDEIGYTTDRSAIHINLSYRSKNISKINVLKVIMNVDENIIYNNFPERDGNVYCKSIKNFIPFKDINYTDISPNILTSFFNFDEDSKYYGINFQHLQKGRLEVRYLGGTDYHTKNKTILDFLDYFIVTIYNCIDKNLIQNDIIELQKYIDIYLSEYKSISSLDKFHSKYLNVSLQVDKDSTYEKVKAYYPRLIDKLYSLISNIENLKDCIINYDTGNDILELVNAEITINGRLKNIVFIKCDIMNGNITSCEILDSSIYKSIVNKCNVDGTDADDCKIVNSKVINLSTIKNCTFSDGFLDAKMIGGIFRHSTTGENAEISDNTDMMKNTKYFFNKKDDIKDDIIFKNK